MLCRFTNSPSSVSNFLSSFTMKTTGRILSTGIMLALFTGTGVWAAPMMAVGDNAQLFFTASAGLRSDDNIYLKNKNEASDTIWSFKPGLDFVFGNNAATKGHAYYTEEFLRYSSHSKQNTSLANVGFTSAYSDGKSKLDLAGSYAQTAQNDVTIPGAIVERNVTNLKGVGEVSVSDKTTVGLGLVYDKNDYGPASYVDSSNFSIPLDGYFEVSPKLAASVGYRYRSVSLSGNAPDGKDHFFSVGARGEFSEKLTGQLRVGYAKRSFTGGKDYSTLGLDSGFNYNFSEKTTFQFTFTNDFGASALGQSTKDRTLAVNAVSKVDSQWSWNVGLSERSIEYPAGRAGSTVSTTDDFFEGNLGVAYTYNTHLNFAAGYTYRNNGSDLAAFEFKNTVFSVGANIRY
jgi:polysaccharide biosynthesis protein VpsM